MSRAAATQEGARACPSHSGFGGTVDGGGDVPALRPQQPQWDGLNLRRQASGASRLPLRSRGGGGDGDFIGSGGGSDDGGGEEERTCSVLVGGQQPTQLHVGRVGDRGGVQANECCGSAGLGFAEKQRTAEQTGLAAPGAAWWNAQRAPALHPDIGRPVQQHTGQREQQLEMEPPDSLYWLGDPPPPAPGQGTALAAVDAEQSGRLPAASLIAGEASWQRFSRTLPPLLPQLPSSVWRDGSGAVGHSTLQWAASKAAGAVTELGSLQPEQQQQQQQQKPQ